MTIEIQTEGRRHYLAGNTYPIRDRLRAAGAKWDPDRRMWWTGKKEVAEQIVAEAGQVQEQNHERERTEGVDKRARVIKGKARYKGRTYLVLFNGQTKRGPAAKLCFRDGSNVFWADGSAVEITKIYREPLSIARLDELAAEYREHGGDSEAVAEARAEKSGRCRGCGGPITNAAHHAAMGGYCGTCAFDEYDC